MDNNTKIRLALDALHHGNFLQVNKNLIKKIGLVNACVLSNMVDKYKYHTKEDKSFDGWFYYSYGWQQSNLNLQKNTLKTAISELLSLGVIKREKRGMPAKFWYCLDFESIVNIVYAPESKESDTQQPSLSRRKVALKSRRKVRLNKPMRRTTKPGASNGSNTSPNNNKGSNNKLKNKKTIRKKEKSFQIKVSPKEEHEKKLQPYLELAKQLSGIVQKTKNIYHDLKQLKRWARDIEKLTTINRIPITEIKEALDWYEDNIGREYVPVIESGSSLRNKFTNLQNAIDREKRPVNKFKKSKVTIGSGISGIDYDKIGGKTVVGKSLAFQN